MNSKLVMWIHVRFISPIYEKTGEFNYVLTPSLFGEKDENSELVVRAWSASDGTSVPLTSCYAPSIPLHFLYFIGTQWHTCMGPCLHDVICVDGYYGTVNPELEETTDLYSIWWFIIKTNIGWASIREKICWEKWTRPGWLLINSTNAHTKANDKTTHYIGTNVVHIGCH